MVTKLTALTVHRFCVASLPSLPLPCNSLKFLTLSGDEDVQMAVCESLQTANTTTTTTTTTSALSFPQGILSLFKARGAKRVRGEQRENIENGASEAQLTFIFSDVYVYSREGKKATG